MRCSTDGTENHCVSSAVRMNSASLCGSRFSWCDTRWSAAPAAKLPNTSKVERSKCSGACPDVRSNGPSPKWRTAHSMKHVTFACVITTPLGIPVDPDVNRMCAGSDGAFRQSIAPGGALSTSPSEKAGSHGRPAGAARSIQPTRTEARSPESRSRSSSSVAARPAARITRGSADPTIFATRGAGLDTSTGTYIASRSEEHTSELQSHHDLVCRLLLEKKNKNY